MKILAPWSIAACASAISCTSPLGSPSCCQIGAAAKSLDGTDYFLNRAHQLFLKTTLGLATCNLFPNILFENAKELVRQSNDLYFNANNFLKNNIKVASSEKYTAETKGTCQLLVIKTLFVSAQKSLVQGKVILDKLQNPQFANDAVALLHDFDDEFELYKSICGPLQDELFNCIQEPWQGSDQCKADSAAFCLDQATQLKGKSFEVMHSAYVPSTCLCCQERLSLADYGYELAMASQHFLLVIPTIYSVEDKLLMSNSSMNALGTKCGTRAAFGCGWYNLETIYFLAQYLIDSVRVLTKQLNDPTLPSNIRTSVLGNVQTILDMNWPAQVDAVNVQCAQC